MIAVASAAAVDVTISATVAVAAVVTAAINIIKMRQNEMWF